MTCSKDCMNCLYGKAVKVKIACSVNSEGGVTCNGCCENCRYNVYQIHWICDKTDKWNKRT